MIGHQNAITYKEVFPLIMSNKLWLGKGFTGGAGHFVSHYEDYAVAGNHKEGMIRVSGVVWFTNIEHGRRHQPLQLMTMADNLKFNKKLKGLVEYQKYVNYDALEIPFSDAIPSDYEGLMGVPITFLDKYCPEQFEIIGISLTLATTKPANLPKSQQGGPAFYLLNEDGYKRLYPRIVIKKQ